MRIPYPIKRMFGNRFALAAVLFLLALFGGSFSTFFGVLGRQTACAGFLRPYVQSGPVKSDPTAPSRRAAARETALDAPAPVDSLGTRLKAAAAKAEADMTAEMGSQHLLIELFGGFQAFSDRTVVEDSAGEGYAVSKLPSGQLTFTGQGAPAPDQAAAELKRLQTVLGERGIPLLYVQAPSKLEPGGAEELPCGVEDTGNSCADALLEALERADIDHLDLRDVFAAQDRAWSSWFYNTDHHWNQDAAFLACQSIGARLEEYYIDRPNGRGTVREKLQLDEGYFDPDNYRQTTLEDYFLGSQGKRVGSLYGGVDDFVLYTPRFATLLRYQAPFNGLDRYGSAEETVLFPERVEERDWYGGNPYTYYAGGDYPIAQATNYYNPDGPRVLLIRESFSCAVTPYLAYACSQLTTVDPRYFTGDLAAYIGQVDPDVVMILYSAGTTRSMGSFRLLNQGGAPGKGDALLWLEK